MRPAPFTQRRRNFLSAKPTGLDWSRVDTAARLLGQGATEGPGPAGQRQLTMPDGSFGMTTSAAVLKAARDRGQEGML